MNMGCILDPWDLYYVSRHTPVKLFGSECARHDARALLAAQTCAEDFSTKIQKPVALIKMIRYSGNQIASGQNF